MSIKTLNNMAPPLDFSFKNLATLTDSLEEEPRKGTKLKDVELQEGYTEIVTAVRYNNNSIHELGDLVPSLTSLVVNPAAISWLDFSFNDINQLDDSLLQFPNMTTLYLHGNQLMSLNEVKRLSGLPCLRTLTLHGNPLEALDGYRPFVLGTLPSLKQLDFSSVTKQDRADAENWKKLCSKKMKMSKKKKAAE